MFQLKRAVAIRHVYCSYIHPSCVKYFDFEFSAELESFDESALDIIAESSSLHLSQTLSEINAMSFRSSFFNYQSRSSMNRITYFHTRNLVDET